MAQNDELRELLRSNQDDFKSLLEQLETLRSEAATKQKLIDDLHKEMLVRPSLNEANASKVEIKHLRNRITELENTQTVVGGETLTESRSVVKVANPAITDAKLVLSEVCEILDLPADDNVALIETVRKIYKVIQAVPRMEGFIGNISQHMALHEDGVQAIPLEQIIPRVQLWKQIVMTAQSSLQPLLNLK